MLQPNDDLSSHDGLIFWIEHLDDNLHCSITSVLHQLYFESRHAVGASDPVATEDIEFFEETDESPLCYVHVVA